jgi:hypothetical protein
MSRYALPIGDYSPVRSPDWRVEPWSATCWSVEHWNGVTWETIENFTTPREAWDFLYECVRGGRTT